MANDKQDYNTQSRDADITALKAQIAKHDTNGNEKIADALRVRLHEMQCELVSARMRASVEVTAYILESLEFRDGKLASTRPNLVDDGHGGQIHVAGDAS